MSEEIQFNTAASRKEIYKELLPQAEALLKPEPDEIARMANLTAILHEIPGFFWVGFDFGRGEERVLGPFQGPVCGAAVREKKMQIVPDVEAFPGHIACSSLSKSEIVIPLFDAERKVWAVLDIDSSKLEDFSELDGEYLERFLRVLDRG